MSVYMFCPKCGADARSWLNLVSCITPGCRNFDAKYKIEWSNKNKPRFRNNTHFGMNHVFLGNYVTGKKVHFDLYYCKSFEDDDICLARCGDSDDDCYYVDGKETDVGRCSTGPITLRDAGVGAALKQALKIARSRKLIARN